MKIELKWRIFIVVAIGIFMSTLDGSILNIANPTIAQNFNVEIDDVKWVVTAYLLVITSTLIFFGRLGDQRGSNRIFTWGFLVFSLGSLGCSLSFTLPMLIGIRIFQGLGASMMMATGIGIVSNAFPDGERGRALGLTGTIVALGNMVGPSVGGLLLGSFEWPIIFLVNVPIGLLGFYFGYKLFPAEDIEDNNKGYDIRGTILLAMTVTALMLALNGSGTMNLILLAAAGLLLFFFCRWERKNSNPLLDFSLFKNRTFVNGNIVAVVAYCTQNSVFFLLPFYLETSLGYSPSRSGFLMTTAPVIMSVTAPLAGHLSDKIGPSRITALSLTLLTAAFLMLTTLDSASTYVTIAGGLVLLGVGMGMFGSPNTSSILGSMPREKAGYGGGFISTNRNLSYSLGISSSVFLFSWILSKKQATLEYTDAYIQSFHTVYLVAAAITAVTLVWWIVEHTRHKPLEPPQG